jgi:hypothetical protein
VHADALPVSHVQQVDQEVYVVGEDYDLPLFGKLYDFFGYLVAYFVVQ